MSVISISAGPKGSLLFGNLTEFGANPLRFLERCAREFGDFVPLRFLHRPVFLLKHRDLRFFGDAEVFRPERWWDESIKKLPKFAYFPFGGGPRVCIGNNFALMEGTLVLASILQNFQVSCKATYLVEPWPSITLQPKDGIWLTLNRAER